jgi:hypothetical protein
MTFLPRSVQMVIPPMAASSFYNSRFCGNQQLKNKGGIFVSPPSLLGAFFFFFLGRLSMPTID